MSKVSIIVAADPNGVIGVNGSMPWHYKADFKRFKERTQGDVAIPGINALIMGRTTWESLPKPLPGRRCIVLTSLGHPNRQEEPPSKHPSGSAAYCSSWEMALRTANAGPVQNGGDIWIAGGARVYADAILQNLVDEIDYTLVPEVPAEKLVGDVVRFPKDLLEGFELQEDVVNAEDDRLRHRIYRCTSQQ